MARLRFNALLQEVGLNPRDVSVILHTPTPPKLRRLLPVIVKDRPDLFTAYQSVHSATAERALKNRPFVASFVWQPPGRQTFAGLFRILSSEVRSTKEIYSDPRFAELETVFGATDTAPAKNIAGIESQVQFEFEPIADLSDYVGRLQIPTPAGRGYVRIAAHLDPEIIVASPDDLLQPKVPDWREMIVDAAFLRALPENWAARLREWRGIYLIVDERDGAHYVGSAYGAENLLSRWRAHVAGAQGITARLRQRDPATFRFSILETVNPNLGPADVIEIENNWKDRLHTREFGLNEN